MGRSTRSTTMTGVRGDKRTLTGAKLQTSIADRARQKNLAGAAHDRKLIDRTLKNTIARALIDRICRARREGKPFFVYVVVPVAPAFEGRGYALRHRDNYACRLQIYLNNASIAEGSSSLMQTLERELRKIELDGKRRRPDMRELPDDPLDAFPLARQHVQFLALRRGEQIGGKLVSEQVYVHSKCMVVDDRQALIGSANINDRSQCGNRDAEVAVVIEGTRRGEPFSFAKQMRLRLWREHLGLLPEDQDLREAPGGDERAELEQAILTPGRPECFALIGEIAAWNTRYFGLFNDDLCHSQYRTWQQLKPEADGGEREPCHEEAAEEERPVGRLVQYPYAFLHDEHILKPLPAVLPLGQAVQVFS